MRPSGFVIASFTALFLSAVLPAQTARSASGQASERSPVVVLGRNAQHLRVSPPRSLPNNPPFANAAPLASNGSPTDILMGFDQMQCFEYVDSYYAGGTGSDGSGPGPNYGITFSSNALVLADSLLNAYCDGNTSYVTNEPTPDNSMIFLSGSAATMDVPAGFTGGFSFYYAAPFDTGFINVWSGLDGTGTLLATLNLPLTGGCAEQPKYCMWNPIGVSFAGTAMSVDFGGTENYIAFDSITLGASVEVNPQKATGNPSDEPGSCGCGDPINIGSGNMYTKVTDYHTAGANALTFDRYYNSSGNLQSFATTLGAKWRSTFDRYIRIIGSTAVTAERADGQELNFTLKNHVWTADSDVDFSLVQSGTAWMLTDNEDNVETYSTASQTEATLQFITARNGYTQTLIYNSYGQLDAVADSYLRALAFTYQNGLLNTVETPEGLVLTYGYTTSGAYTLLTSVAYSTTPATSQTYLYQNSSLPFALTGVQDENGNVVASWTYDSSARALSSQHANGADLVTVTYDDATGARTVTNALGVADTYTFATLQGVSKVTAISRASTSTTAAATEAFTYDNNGYVASKTDWNGNKTTYANNSRGLPSKITEASGTPLARVTTITYDSVWVHLPDTIATNGLTTSFTYDESGEVLTRTLTDTTSNTAPYSTNGQTRTWTNTWSDALLTSTRSPNGHTTAYAYDSSGALISTTDAAGHVTRIAAHTRDGFPLTVVDPDGVTTTLTYSPRQWLTSSTMTGVGGAFKTTWTYDAAGNMVKVTLPDKSYQANAYDQAHRLFEVVDADGNYIHYTLDALGDRTVAYVYQKGGTSTRKRRGTFDALGRLLVDTGGAGQKTTRTYDANDNVLTILDGRSHRTANTYDALNRLSSSSNANGGVTTQAYDTHDHVVSVQDPNGGKTTYVRDGFGEAIRQSSPDSDITVFTYDGDGNLVGKTDAVGNVTNQTFDALDRVLTTTYPADSTKNVSYAYDQTGTGFAFGIGRLTSVADAAGSLTRSYDERGNLAVETRINGSTKLTTSYTYDGAGRVASVTYPDTTVVTDQRDAAGYLSGVAATPAGAAGSTTLATIAHLPFGPANSVTYGNGIAETWTFDLDYRATNIADSLSGQTVQNLTYAYDNANNVTAIADGVNAADSQTLTYDAINRLVGAVSGAGGYGTESWTYDKVGNRLTQNLGGSTTAYGYGAGRNRLTSIGAVAVTTNNDGNIVKMPTANSAALATFTYSVANRVASVSGSPLAAKFAYDWSGQRFSKTNPGTTPILYTYLRDGTLIAESNNGVVTDYVYADGRPIAVLQPAAAIAANQVNAVLTDRLGTPQLAVNSAGSTVWQATYQPFGATGTVNASITQNLRFPGQYADVETGFTYNMHRDYMPNLGRYVESDPAGLKGGTNSYNYVEARPLVAIDPSGLWQITITAPLIWPGTEGQITFGNNGGTGGGWRSLFNGQWNLGAYAGVGIGASVSLDPTNAGCSRPGTTWGVRESASAGLGGGGLSVDESAAANTNGSASIEAGIDTPYDGLTGTVSTNGRSIEGTIAPVIGAGTEGLSVFAGAGGTTTW